MKRKIMSVMAALIAGLTVSSMCFAHHECDPQTVTVQQDEYAGPYSCNAYYYIWEYSWFSGRYERRLVGKRLSGNQSVPSTVNRALLTSTVQRFNPFKGDFGEFEIIWIYCTAEIPYSRTIDVQHETCPIIDHQIGGAPACDGHLVLNSACVLEECPNEMPQPYRDMCRDSVSTYTQCSECVGGSSSSSSSSSSTSSGGSSCGPNAGKTYASNVCGSSIPSMMSAAASYCGSCGVRSSGSSCVRIYCGQ